jgi:hypothetical protein
MTMKLSRSFVAGILLGLLVAGVALAQTAGTQLLKSLAGTEMIALDYPGSVAVETTVAAIRNTTGYQLLSSASGTIAPTNLVDNLLVNAQPAASTTINTPLLPYDAELFAVCNVTNAAWATNTVTLAAASGSSLATGVTTNLTTLAARTCEELQYVASNTTWYQVR